MDGKMKIDEQLKKIDKATDKALQEIEEERKGKTRDYIAEWFKWVAKVSKYLKKHILN
jgi:t-SNARE complex subunit (syntaxin)